MSSVGMNRFGAEGDQQPGKVEIVYDKRVTLHYNSYFLN